MAKRKYKFTDKKHTRQGLASLGLGAFALALTAAALFLAYRASGQAGVAVGLLGLLALLAAGVGFVLAVRAFREEDVYYISAQVGVAVNALLFIAWVMVCVIGL